jgi:hypothetical protein
MLAGLTPVIGEGVGEGVGDGVGVGDVGVTSWVIPGISERKRFNPLWPLPLPERDELPSTAVDSPVPPDEVLVEAAETDDEPTDDAEVEEAGETAARLLCCVLMVVERAPEGAC